jgi:RNA polymerase sigma-70 factor (ECF subfamily)
MNTRTNDSPDSVKSEPLTAAPSAEFLQLFTKSQRPVFLYILSLVPRPVEAEEILQETNLVIWTKASQFRPGTNFQAWACQIAYFEVMKYRSRRHRDKLHFNPELLELVAAESLQESELLDRRRQALAECLAKLREQDRALIQTRYSPENDGPEIADKIGRPINSIYQSLSRIRKSLLECINRRLAAEARG